MDRRTRQSFLMRSRQKEFKQRVKYSKEIIDKCFERFDKPYVAFSGGKDSVAMLGLILEDYPDVHVENWGHGSYLLPPKYQREIEENALRMGVNPDHFHLGSSKQLEHPDARWDYMRWYRSMFSYLKRLISEEGFDCAFLGLRMEESSARKWKARNPFNYTDDRNCPQCYPVHMWSWEDVWAYIVANDLPYLSHYDLYAGYSGWDGTRICTFFDEEFQHKNGVDGVLMPEFRNRE